MVLSDDLMPLCKTLLRTTLKDESVDSEMVGRIWNVLRSMKKTEYAQRSPVHNLGSFSSHSLRSFFVSAVVDVIDCVEGEVYIVHLFCSSLGSG